MPLGSAVPRERKRRASEPQSVIFSSTLQITERWHQCAGASLVRVVATEHVARDQLRLTGSTQRNARPAETGAGELGTVDAVLREQQGDERIEGRDRNLVVVAKTPMRRRHELPELNGVDALRGAQGARILRDDVPRAPSKRLGQALDRGRL